MQTLPPLAQWGAKEPHELHMPAKARVEGDTSVLAHPTALAATPCVRLEPQAEDAIHHTPLRSLQHGARRQGAYLRRLGRCLHGHRSAVEGAIEEAAELTLGRLGSQVLHRKPVAPVELMQPATTIANLHDFHHRANEFWHGVGCLRGRVRGAGDDDLGEERDPSAGAFRVQGFQIEAFGLGCEPVLSTHELSKVLFRERLDAMAETRVFEAIQVEERLKARTAKLQPIRRLESRWTVVASVIVGLHCEAERHSCFFNNDGLPSSGGAVREGALRVLECTATPAQCIGIESGRHLLLSRAVSIAKDEAASPIAVRMEVQVEAEPPLVLMCSEACSLGGKDGGVLLKGGAAVYTVQVLPTSVAPVVAQLYTIRVQDRYNVEDVALQQRDRSGVARREEVKESLQQKTGRRLPRVNPCADENRPATLEDERTLRACAEAI
mmetsp:Transcript_92392/g.206522  ORF Transcript_92392/g.206522 Transcript_92392/m.206522 type:complete len:438 (+) Transcript_92392:1-1314(+)